MVPGTLEFRGMPELPEMEIVARRLAEVLPGERVESALAPGINALKTFDPPLHALEGRAFTGVRRRGKLLMLDPGDRELRVREFGTKQSAWVKVLRAEAVDGDEALQGLGPEAWPDPPELRELLDAPR